MNHYVIANGTYTEIMLYWYQGRGRIEPNEYRDKINTIWDSITRRRSDGVLRSRCHRCGLGRTGRRKAAADLAARLVENLTPFVPE